MLLLLVLSVSSSSSSSAAVATLAVSAPPPAPAPRHAQDAEGKQHRLMPSHLTTLIHLVPVAAIVSILLDLHSVLKMQYA